MSTQVNQFTNAVEVTVIQDVVQVVPIAAQGPAGPPGPNSISSTTALGTLTDYTSNSPFVLASDPTSLLAGKIPLGSFGRSWLATTNQAAAQSALGLGSAALQNTLAFDAAGAATSAYNSAITYSANAGNLSSGTVPLTRLSGITTSQLSATAGIANAQLANSSITIAGTSTALGGSITQDTITGLASTGIVKRSAANTLGIAVAADFPTLNQSTTGNAATATKLAATVNINGVAFDGSTGITVAAAAGTLTGTTLASGVTTSSLTSLGTLTALQLNGTLSLGSTTDTQLSKSSAGNILFSNPVTTNGSVGITYKAVAQTLQTVGSDIFSFTNATDSTYTAKRVLTVNAFGGAQPALTLSAQSAGYPYVSLTGASSTEVVRISPGSNGASAYIAVSQGASAIDTADIRLGYFTTNQLGLYRYSGGSNVGSFLYYNTSNGDTVVNTVFSGAGVSIQYLGTEVVRVKSTGMAISGNGTFFKLPSMTVANLTAAATAGFGSIACVTDATATTAGTTVAGGGANIVYVRSNGTNWIIF